ncbi:MAG TPA: alpha-glucan family phosphorylase [Dehalococcoidia bacterium]|nr:alpha-glucan family phosphorylase [Dehalococcoidia bacterium]
MIDTTRSIAYFSMEIGLDLQFPTYSGGLGVLAGDSLRASADLRIPMVGVTLVHRKGYFHQHLDESGQQTESPADWSPEDHLEELPHRVSVQVEGRTVHLRAWVYVVHGSPGNDAEQPLPVYLLDSRLPENDPRDQELTDVLYGGDPRYRLSQEVILGMGGVALLRELGYNDIGVFHLNEGHSGLLVLALMEERMATSGEALTEGDVQAIRSRCVFTVHTPVAAGHDTFPVSLTEEVLGSERIDLLRKTPAIEDEMFDLTAFVISMSRSANGVSMRHGQVSAGMFPEYPVGAITNGVHAGTWVAEPVAQMFDRHMPLWRRDTWYLRYAAGIPLAEIRAAHQEAKDALVAEVRARSGVALAPTALTIGFARRATGYKRGDLLFTDIDRLRRLVTNIGPLQVVYAGKAHPKDDEGKRIIQDVFAAAGDLGDAMKVVYLQDYDMTLGKCLVSGVDLWLNNPQKPLEASGTSGMKAAMNGVPSFSVLDGWWIEGRIEGRTGWAIGDENPIQEEDEIRSLYDKLERDIMPMYYQRPDEYATVMRYCISHNGEFFSAQRMMFQYLRDVYQAPTEGFTL